METILNLVWVAVTLAALWLWRFRWAGSRRNPRFSPVQESVAVLCFIAFIFPVISLTDDLHPEIVAVDAVGGKRNSSAMVAGARIRSSASHSNPHRTVVALQKPLVLFGLATAEKLSPAKVLVASRLSDVASSRSPPSFS